MRRLPWFLVILTALLACAPPAAERPNIVWIVSEDQSEPGAQPPLQAAWTPSVCHDAGTSCGACPGSW